ncbi:MAG: iron complex transport system substrate-binding protein [Methanohalophilus sp.]|nr:MAG: iron complex transport system substrate-binding protein [Methanohalophilus sp.]
MHSLPSILFINSPMEVLFIIRKFKSHSFVPGMTLVVVLMLLAISLTGCVGNDTEENTQSEIETISITDMAGRNVEVPKNVDRVVAVGAGALRQVVYLGAVDKVVGVEQYEFDDPQAPYSIAYQDEISDLPGVGPNHGGDSELIAATNPDVIFFSGISGDVSDAANLQKKTGIPVIYVYIGDLYVERDKLYETWGLYGEVLGEEERADELIEYTEGMLEDFDVITQDIPEDEIASAYAGGTSHRGSHGIRATKYPFPSFEFLNVDNVIEGVDYEVSTSMNVNRENLLAWNPEVIFIDMGNLGLVTQDIKDNPSYLDMKAFKEDNVYGIYPTSSYHRNIDNVLINTYYIGSVLYPEKFDGDIATKADEIYEVFLGKPVYEEMQGVVGSYGKLNFEE